MKYAMTAILALGAVALAAPASAQLVNGLSGPNYNHETPIGAKSGGSPSSLKAPGEAAAVAGALRNERDAKMLQAKFTQPARRKVAQVRSRIVVRNDADQRLRISAE